MEPVILKVIIGTPIHEIKDYAMERWLKNVSELKYPADFLMVDNSPGLDYVQKVKSYCEKVAISNYKIKHIELPPTQEKHERVARSREIIRQHILARDYDAWCTWACDEVGPVILKCCQLLAVGIVIIAVGIVPLIVVQFV